jgi:LCP family protein required for cell wall assembly
VTDDAVFEPDDFAGEGEVASGFGDDQLQPLPRPEDPLGELSIIGDFSPISRDQVVRHHVGEDESLVKVRHRLKGAAARRTRVGFGVFAATMALIIAAAAIWVHSLNASMRPDPDEYRKLVEALAAPGITSDSNAHPNAFYALIVGSDERKDVEGARGDVIMLARLDPDDGTVDLISIPRDTMVNIEGHGTCKLNSAYAYGGAEAMVKVVSEFAGVPITHYMEIGFDGLVQVVDRLGGIWIDVPEAFTAGKEHFAKGAQRVTGERALIYARERHSFGGGDFTRVQSQRQVVSGIAKQVMDTSPAELPGIIGDIAKMTTTDCSIRDLVSLALAFRRAGIKVYQTSCPSYAYDADGVSYVATMYDEWRGLMCRVDAGLEPDDTDAPIPKAQSENKALGAAPNGAGPRDYHELAQTSLSTENTEKTD